MDSKVELEKATAHFVTLDGLMDLEDEIAALNKKERKKELRDYRKKTLQYFIDEAESLYNSPLIEI